MSRKKKKKKNIQTKFATNLVDRTLKAGIPIIILHRVNQYKDVISPKLVDAYMKDLKSNNIVPINLLHTQLEERTLVNDLIKQVLLPSITDSVNKDVKKSYKKLHTT